MLFIWKFPCPAVRRIYLCKRQLTEIPFWTDETRSPTDCYLFPLQFDDWPTWSWSFGRDSCLSSPAAELWLTEMQWARELNWAWPALRVVSALLLPPRIHCTPPTCNPRTEVVLLLYTFVGPPWVVCYLCLNNVDDYFFCSPFRLFPRKIACNDNHACIEKC